MALRLRRVREMTQLLWLMVMWLLYQFDEWLGDILCQMPSLPWFGEPSNQGSLSARRSFYTGSVRSLDAEPLSGLDCIWCGTPWSGAIYNSSLFWIEIRIFNLTWSAIGSAIQISGLFWIVDFTPNCLQCSNTGFSVHIVMVNNWCLWLKMWTRYTRFARFQGPISLFRTLSFCGEHQTDR